MPVIIISTSLWIWFLFNLKKKTKIEICRPLMGEGWKTVSHLGKVLSQFNRERTGIELCQAQAQMGLTLLILAAEFHICAAKYTWLLSIFRSSSKEVTFQFEKFLEASLASIERSSPIYKSQILEGLVWTKAKHQNRFQYTTTQTPLHFHHTWEVQSLYIIILIIL